MSKKQMIKNSSKSLESITFVVNVRMTNNGFDVISDRCIYRYSMPEFNRLFRGDRKLAQFILESEVRGVFCDFEILMLDTAIVLH